MCCTPHGLLQHRTHMFHWNLILWAMIWLFLAAVVAFPNWVGCVNPPLNLTILWGSILWEKMTTRPVGQKTPDGIFHLGQSQGFSQCFETTFSLRIFCKKLEGWREIRWEVSTESTSDAGRFLKSFQIWERLVLLEFSSTSGTNCSWKGQM